MRTARPPACRTVVERPAVRPPPCDRDRTPPEPSGAGDADELERADAFLLSVIERYRSPLLRYVGRLTTGDPHRAEDIVQETLLRAWLAADRLAAREDGSGLGPWLFTVARNLAVDAHRRERSVPVGSAPDEALRTPDRADMAEAVVDRCVVTQALARLSPEHRDVLVLVHLLGRSGAEAALAMGIPRGTVKSRTHYALLAMRRELLTSPGRTHRPTPESRAA